jgi:hypothetical protein
MRPSLRLEDERNCCALSGSHFLPAPKNLVPMKHEFRVPTSAGLDYSNNRAIVVWPASLEPGTLAAEEAWRTAADARLPTSKRRIGNSLIIMYIRILQNAGVSKDSVDYVPDQLTFLRHSRIAALQRRTGHLFVGRVPRNYARRRAGATSILTVGGDYPFNSAGGLAF